MAESETWRADVDDLVELVNELVDTLEAARRTRREQERQAQGLRTALGGLLCWADEVIALGAPRPPGLEAARRLLVAGP